MRIILIAALLMLAGCGHQSCTQDEWLVNQNCK